MTNSEIKYANLIFVEHNKLLKENDLLYSQLRNYTLLNYQLEQIDSLRLKQVSEYRIITDNQFKQIDNLNKQIKKSNKTLHYWQIGGVTVSVGLILFLLFK